jgi:hypothetical protein
MSFMDRLSVVLLWARRALLLLVLVYFSYSMLLMGYICVGTGLESYGQAHRLFYLSSGPLLLLGGLAIFAYAVRWVSRIIKEMPGRDA